MPIKPMPQFKAVPEKMLEIAQPAIGGLNLKDLEYEQGMNQSPYMLNVMYRNGSFGKRYGQEIHSTYGDTLYAGVEYKDLIIVHAGKKIYKYTTNGNVQIASGLPESTGIFIIYAQKLYYLISSGFYSYDGTTWATVDPYVPEFIINCKPDGSTGGDVLDDLNLIGSKFKLIYNGETGVDTYEVGPYDSADIIDWDVTPTIWVDDEEDANFTVDKANKQIVFTTAPPEGDLNVVMEFTMKSTVFSTEKTQILSCKYYETFGGANNSRLFLAGCGKSKYFYSQAYDISYFPENNFATLGNTAEDITGFGRQYNVLIVFKPREVYSIYSYTESASTTVIEENYGLENFRSQLVNARIGCDAPHSIQLVNNLLTWFNSREGICTLVSTNIQDERNVRIISRNIERTNNFNVKGILDIEEDPANISSVDYNNKYFLCFPTSGYCFMWDYEITPYRYSSTGSETNPKELGWYLFDHFYVKQFLKYEKELLYIPSYNGVEQEVVQQRFPNGNFADTSEWVTLGNNTFSVTDNVGYVTVSQAGDGIGQLLLVEADKDYYLSITMKNTTPLELDGFEGNSNKFVRRSRIIHAKSLIPDLPAVVGVSFELEEDLDTPATIEIKDVMLFKMSDFSEPVTKEQLDYYITGYSDGHIDIGNDYTKDIVKLNDAFVDLDFDGDTYGDAIHCYYMTPFLQFGAVEMLKNVKNIYVQTRGDTASEIDMYYYTDDSLEPEEEPESIIIGGKLWKHFNWSTFQWQVMTWANTFRRKCNLKKIQMASFFFDNNQVGRDMAITHIGLQYQLVKYIR